MEPLALNPRAILKQRVANLMTSSIVQTILNRELGFPNFSRSTECMSNGINEKNIGRYLVNQRNFYHADSTVSPEIVNLDNKKKLLVPKDAEQTCQTWFKIMVTKKTNIFYEAGLLWKTTFKYKLYSGRVFYSDCFYKMEPDHYQGFKTFSSSERQGRLGESEVAMVRSSKSQRISTVLFALSEKGMLTATKLSSVDQIRVADYHDLNSDDLSHRFTSFSLDYENEKIYVVSTVGTKKFLYVLNYPPWDQTPVIRIMIQVPKKIEVYGYLALVYDTNKIEVIPVSSFVEQSQSSTNCNVNITTNPTHDCYPVCQRVLTEKPTSIFTASTVNEFFGVLNSTWPPLYYVKTKTGITIHRMEDSSPIWSCTVDPYSLFLVEPMPDESNAIFLTVGREQRLVSWSKGTDVESHVVSESNPFVLDIPSQHNDVRPRRARACKSHQIYRECNSSHVLGLNYFDGLDLVVVCSAVSGSGETLAITLYETRSFKLFKRLPSVNCLYKGRRRDKEDSNISLLDKISNVFVKFDFEMIFVKLCFDTNSEIFCLRILEENIYNRIM